MNFLFVLEYYYPHIGGVEILFKNICERLSKKGHNITILTSQIENTPKEENINGVKVIRIKTPNRYFFTFLAVFKAIKLAREADVIHTTTYNGAFPAWVCAKIRRKPVVITVHEVWVGKWRKYTQMNFFSATIHNLLEKAIYILRFDRYIGVSRFTRYELLREGIAPKYARTIRNGFDDLPWKTKENMREELGLKDKYVILAYGRPGISKGFSYLLEATREVKKNIPNAEVILMLSKSKSTIKQREILEARAKEVGAKIIDPLPYSELPKLVNSADCIVIPSLSEGFGYVVVESCSLGKKVVASNVASIPEVVFGEANLVEPGNSMAIAKGIINTYQEKTKTYEKKDFSWETNIIKHEELYKELCSPSRRY